MLSNRKTKHSKLSQSEYSAYLFPGTFQDNGGCVRMYVSMCVRVCVCVCVCVSVTLSVQCATNESLCSGWFQASVLLLCLSGVGSVSELKGEDVVVALVAQ